MAPKAFIQETHVIDEPTQGCEMLCYMAGDRCGAANLQQLDNGSYVCQFVSLVVRSEHKMFLVAAQYHTKYISKNSGKYSLV